MYSNSCSSCSYQPEIIKIGQSFYKMYSNKILHFQVSTTILNAHTKKVWKFIEGTTYHRTEVTECYELVLSFSMFILDCVFCFVYFLQDDAMRTNSESECYDLY